MRANDVKIGGEYMAKLGGKLIHVRIVAEKPAGGWSAINVASGKKVLITMGGVLQSEVANAEVPPATEDETITSMRNAKPARKRKAKAEANDAIVATDETNAGTDETIVAKTARARKERDETDAALQMFHPARKLSQLDAAIQVLGEATEPLTTKQMVEAMITKNLWASPGGKTPHATLYSAILRELQTKGDAARFVKTDRGHFQLRSA